LPKPCAGSVNERDRLPNNRLKLAALREAHACLEAVFAAQVSRGVRPINFDHDLWRPVGLLEMAKVFDAGMRSVPPRFALYKVVGPG
jgi:hypothetical protein